MSDDQAAETPSPSLADKLNQAFATLHPADRGPYSNREVARWLQQHARTDDPTISVNYIAMLRSGERNNPTVRHLQALARFFDINPAYFIEDSARADAVHADLKLVAAMRDAEVRDIAARALDLDPAMRKWLHDTVAGLPPSTSPKRSSERFIAPPDDE